MKHEVKHEVISDADMRTQTPAAMTTIVYLVLLIFCKGELKTRLNLPEL